MRRSLLLALAGGLAATGAAAPALAAAKMTPEVWHPKLVAFTPAGEVGTEFGSGLSDAGFQKLRKALEWEEGKTRTDYYYDGFDGTQFLLKNDAMPVKVRVKQKKKGPEWQVSRFVSKDRVQVGGLSIKVHTTESWSGKLKGAEADAFMAATTGFFGQLDVGGAKLRQAGDKVDVAFRALKAAGEVEGAMVLDHHLAKRKYKLYPTKRTPNKTRLEADLPGFKGPKVVLQLGTETERDPQGRSIVVHELEAEPESPLTAAQTKQAAEAVGRLMLKAGLTAKDQEAPVTRSWAYTTAQLKR